MDLTSVFGGVENAKPIGGFAGRLAIGSHTLVLKRFQVKESAKGKGKIVEADFSVLESNTMAAGETKGWAWFIGSAGFAGQYEEARLKVFIENVGVCIGDKSTVSVMGAALAGPGQAGRGLMLKCQVSAQTNRDGSPRKNDKGETYTQIEWLPVPQGLEDIKAARALLDGPGAAQTTAAEPAAQQQALPAQGAGAGMSALLASLKR